MVREQRVSEYRPTCDCANLWPYLRRTTTTNSTTSHHPCTKHSSTRPFNPFIPVSLPIQYPDRPRTKTTSSSSPFPFLLNTPNAPPPPLPPPSPPPRLAP
ncbi:hypothetical protein E2C01_050065 [Portunus trituberculatus]|uniref:Uncharacterized protein n=1 Tax=Portunus trituberculatus TaxID=210409 RepID=A0A5B7GFI4_PORTR|nr:hypothetical protein [Portunus trituberculatus]